MREIRKEFSIKLTLSMQVFNNSPDVLNFLKNKNSYYIPNPSDSSFEILNNYNSSCNVDVFLL